MSMVLYKNIILYKNNFYIDKTQIKIVSLNDRIYKPFIPLDIDTIELKDNPEKFDKIVLLIDSFHWNPAHTIWNFFYPSWYGLFHIFNKDSEFIDFKWITIADLNDIHVYTHKDIIETFSGCSLDSLTSFGNKYNKPLLIPFLITGLDGIGIGHINKNNLIVKRGIEINNIDPVEKFINRIYFKYNIKRNSLFIESDYNKCNNVIFIKNKRQYNGIEELFSKMNNKYKDKYIFKIIDYSNFNFEDQLHILNNTCICIVGVGSARFNTSFLPNGSIEIQTFQPNINKKNYIEYLDYHAGTLSKYVKVKNIPYYTKEEVDNNLYSHLLETYIDEAINEIPCKLPINLEENIPLDIRKLKEHKNYDKMFDIWRNSMSNIIEDLFNMLEN